MDESDLMKVNQIRQDHFVEEYLLLHITDVEQVLIHKNEFVEIPCPACEQERYVCKFEKSGFSFVECSACGTLFINPRPTARLLSDFYRTARSFNIFNEKIYPASETARRELIFSPRAARVVELCKRYLTDSATTLVDVGAGFGTFCEEIQKLAFFKNVIAVEPSPTLAETCRLKGLKVLKKSIEEIHFEDDISVTVCFELIEHLFKPRDFLLNIGRKTSGGGLLILTTPNIDGFDLKVLGPLSENVDGPEHLNYFNKKSLGSLLEQCGFNVLETITPGRLDAELVRKKALAGVINLENQPFLKQVLIDEWDSAGEAFQQFIAEQGLSSHMWIVARRRL